MEMKAVLAPVPGFVRWTMRQEMKLHSRLRHLMLDIAIVRAFQKFRLQHPRWAASLFDEYFLTGPATPLLARYLQRDAPPTPAELAAAWFDEVRPTTSALFGHRQTEVTAVAADFLADLETELQALQVQSLPRPHHR